MTKQRFWASRDKDSDCVQLWRGEKPMPKRHGRYFPAGNLESTWIAIVEREDCVALFGFNVREGRCVEIRSD